MKIEFIVHTLGKPHNSDRISVGAIVGNSCHAADGNKIRQASR